MAQSKIRKAKAPAVKDVEAHSTRVSGPEGHIRQPAPESQRSRGAEAETEPEAKDGTGGPDGTMHWSDRGVKRDIVPVVW